MAWGVVYYRAPDGSIPAEKFLDACPTKVNPLLITPAGAMALDARVVPRHASS